MYEDDIWNEKEKNEMEKTEASQNKKETDRIEEQQRTEAEAVEGAASTEGATAAAVGVTTESTATEETSERADSKTLDGQKEQAASSAQETQGERRFAPNRSYIPEEPRRIRRKKSSVGRKIAGITAAAVLFGSVAGVSMFGVNLASGKLAGIIYPMVRQSQTAVDSSSVTGTADSGVVSVASNLDVSAIVKQAMPSVVAITNKQVFQSNSWLYGTNQYEGESSGSGIIIGQNDSELLIVTNNHVVEDATELKVTFIDNSTVDAAIKGTDEESDLAIVAIQKKDIPESTFAEISVATVGDSDSLEPGQGVIAIGNALGYGQSTTVGYVSAVNREVSTRDASSGQISTRNMIQVDAAINPGNSGGALLNMKGEVIGINAAKYASTDVEGVGYAIPITYAEEIIGDLMNRQTRIEVAEDEQAYLGIQGQNITQEMSQAFGMPRGVYVYKILEGGAAESSDLKEKDIITKIDGTTVKSMSDLQEMLTYFKGNTTVDLTVQRLVDGEYQETTVSVKLGYRTQAQELQNQTQKQQ
ncbi:MAG: trypsin-like peptidase domain-containing protein [bacterium]|nr:trypsin-like peptidase domain-containing protein [bacterium]